MLDNDTFLLASIFRKASRFNPPASAAEFLHAFEFRIDQTCRLLKLLGLVEEAPSSLGFKPTHRLIEITADRVVGPTTKSNSVAKVDYDFVHLLWQLVSNGSVEDDAVQNADLLKEQAYEPDEDEDDDNDDEAQDFCRQVLVVLGLLKDGDDKYQPTPLIHKLLLKTCVQQLSKAD